MGKFTDKFKSYAEDAKGIVAHVQASADAEISKLTNEQSAQFYAALEAKVPLEDAIAGLDISDASKQRLQQQLASEANFIEQDHPLIGAINGGIGAINNGQNKIGAATRSAVGKVGEQVEKASSALGTEASEMRADAAALAEGGDRLEAAGAKTTEVLARGASATSGFLSRVGNAAGEVAKGSAIKDILNGTSKDSGGPQR